MTDKNTIEGVNNGIDNLIKDIHKLQSENTRLKVLADNQCDDCACEIANERDKLKTERDKAVELAVKLMKIFVIPQKDYDKYFRKLKVGAGVYMGTGYAIMDAFYRVYDDFVDNSDDDLYHAIKRGLEE